MTDCWHHSTRPRGCDGFTLVELLMATAVLATLLSLLLPGLRRAREQARAAVCASNVHQLAVANMLYAADHNGSYCPGASDFAENRHRWHGVRDSSNQPFDPRRGPLTPYSGPDRRIRACPSFRDVLEAGFEKGNGGYGYNLAYLGRVLHDAGHGFWIVVTDRTGEASEWVRRPGQTLMFADAAFAARRDGVIEYSFAEPRFHPTHCARRADPSLHFRHGGRANVAWCDGHVDGPPMTFTWRSGLYPGDPQRHSVGWFGQRDDNTYFELR